MPPGGGVLEVTTARRSQAYLSFSASLQLWPSPRVPAAGESLFSSKMNACLEGEERKEERQGTTGPKDSGVRWRGRRQPGAGVGAPS